MDKDDLEGLWKDYQMRSKQVCEGLTHKGWWWRRTCFTSEFPCLLIKCKTQRDFLYENSMSTVVITSTDDWIRLTFILQLYFNIYSKYSYFRQFCFIVTIHIYIYIFIFIFHFRISIVPVYMFIVTICFCIINAIIYFFLLISASSFLRYKTEIMNSTV